MINWFKNLSTAMKLIVIGAVIIIVLFILSFVGGWSSGVKGWIADKVYAERMAKVDELEKANAELKAKNVELDKQILEVETENKILVTNDKALEQKAKEEQGKLDVALAAQDAEEARTGESIDDYTRCLRVKQKMIDQNSKTAPLINCEQRYKK